MHLVRIPPQIGIAAEQAAIMQLAAPEAWVAWEALVDWVVLAVDSATTTPLPIKEKTKSAQPLNLTSSTKRELLRASLPGSRLDSPKSHFLPAFEEPPLLSKAIKWF
jgi:hypothetical protein